MGAASCPNLSVNSVLIRSRLTPLEINLLEAFFQLETRFFLTGGAVLAGF